MKCLFFGASGYLGRHLVDALKEKGHQVTVPAAANGSRMDLTLPGQLNDIDWEVDTVYMFAGVTGTVASFDQYENYLLGNNLALLNVLNSLRTSRSRARVVFPSTRLIFQGSENPLLEGAAQEAKTLYAANKIACEHYMHAYANAFDIPYTILRICVPYANLIGNEYSFGTVGNFINQARVNRTIKLYGGGNIRRTFSHIKDICSLAILSAEHPATCNRTFNIPGEDLSLHQAASVVAHQMNASVESTEWPALDARIESGSTVFDGKQLLEILQTKLHHRFVDWAKTIPRHHD